MVPLATKPLQHERQVIGAVMTAEEEPPDATDASPNLKAERDGPVRVTQPMWSALRDAVVFQPMRPAKPPRVLEMRALVEKSYWSLRMLCVVSAAGLFGASVLSVLNVFDSYLSPLQNLLALYNLILSAAVFVAEGRKGWFRRCGDVQNGLFRRVTVLGSRPGRAALYFYMGSVCLLMLPGSFVWKLVYLGLGASFCLMSALSACDHAGDFEVNCAPKEHPTDEENTLDPSTAPKAILELPVAPQMV